MAILSGSGGSTTFSAVNNDFTMNVSGRNSVGFNFSDAAATWVGTIVAEVSHDSDAGTWVAVRFFNPNTRAYSASVTAPGLWTIPLFGGATRARARCSAYTAGSMVVEGHAVDTSAGVVLAELVSGTSAGDLGKAEDSVHASSDTGVMMLGVRKDTATALAADGDYIPLIVAADGALHVKQAALDYTVDDSVAYDDGLVLRPTITTSSTAYTAGDNIGGIITLAAPLASGLPVALRSIVLKDDKNQKPALQLLFFRTSPDGTYTDNAAVVVSTADMGALVHIQSVAAADWVTIQGITKAAVSYTLNDGPVLGPGTTSIFMVIVTVGTPTYAVNSTDLTAELGFKRMS